MGILLTQAEIDKIAYDTKDNALVYGWDLQKAMDTMTDRFLKAQLKKVTEWLKEVETREYDQQVLWHCIRDQDFQELLKGL